METNTISVINEAELRKLRRSHEVIRELIDYNGVEGIQEYKDALFHIMSERVVIQYDSVNPEVFDKLCCLFMHLEEVIKLVKEGEES